jgi:hypothetical protein
MDTFGAMWLDTARDLHGRPALAVELLYMEDGDAGIDDVAERVGTLLDLDVTVLVRVDWRRGQTVPATGDFPNKFEYARFFGERLASHPDISRVQGFIVGNEPNLKSENQQGPADVGIPADWYMKVHSGAGANSDDNADVYTQLRTNGYAGGVLIAPVAPWSAQADGTLDWYPTPPGASGTMHWLRYAATLYWYACNASRMPRADVVGAIHTYSNVLACRQRGLDAAQEPSYRDELRNPDWNACQYGIRVYDEFLQQMSTQAGGASVPHYVTEWNSLVGLGPDGQLEDPAWPCNNYPAGLLRNAVDYLKGHEGLRGFALFVDQDLSGACPFWQASAARGHLGTVQLSALQQANLKTWDAEFDAILQSGW